VAIAAPVALPVAAGAAGDLCDPCTKSLGLPQLIQPAERLEEDILGDVMRRGHIATGVIRDRTHQPRVTVV
jgi:hypothetical protein